MQWLLQEFEDTQKLAEALERLGVGYTWHKVVPFVGDLIPAPDIRDPDDVVLFGAYTLWRYAKAHDLRPGVFKLTPFVDEAAWHPFLLNGAASMFLTLRDVPGHLAEMNRDYFMRPVDDGKEQPGRVRSAEEIVALAKKALALNEAEIPLGSLRHDTLLMFSEPVRILKEWRIWAVDGQIVTWSQYKEGSRVVYRHTIDDDALAFAQRMVDINRDYSPAYVLDICRTYDGLKLLETNCLNAAGFYAADLQKLVQAIESLGAR